MEPPELNGVWNELERSGGQVYFTGGCIRNELLGEAVTDLDVVVFCMGAEALERTLSRFGPVSCYGKTFPIRKVTGFPVEFALPRLNHEKARLDPAKAMNQDAMNRDFTVNAMYRHVKTGVITDPLNGREDLDRRLLRQTSANSMKQDPLRVCRAFQLMSRYSMKLETHTAEHMRFTALTDTPVERIVNELDKWLMGEDPENGWKGIVDTRHLSLIYSEEAINAFRLVKPIGKALNHSLKYRRDSKEPLLLMWCVLLAPLFLQGYPPSGLTPKGLSEQRYQSKRLKSIKDRLEALQILLTVSPRKPDMIRVCRKTHPEELERLVLSLIPLWETWGMEEKVTHQLETFRTLRPERVPKPVVTGEDLMRAGVVSGPALGTSVKTAYEMQMEGVAKEDIIAFFRKYPRLFS